MEGSADSMATTSHERERVSVAESLLTVATRATIANTNDDAATTRSDDDLKPPPAALPQHQSLPPAVSVDKNGRRMYRVACRARGVSPDHRPETAYLLIAEDAKHGELLYCSHKECARLKRSFRYCAICRQPVAKRNFQARHGHALLQNDENGRTIFPPAPPPPKSNEQQLQESSNVARLVTSSQGALNNAQHEVSASSATQKDRTKKRQRSSRNNDGRPRDVAVKQRVTDAASANDDSPSGLSSGDSNEGMPSRMSPNEAEWLELYRGRPQNHDVSAMSDWLHRVVGRSVSFLSQNGEEVREQLRRFAQGETTAALEGHQQPWNQTVASSHNAEEQKTENTSEPSNGGGRSLQSMPSEGYTGDWSSLESSS